MTRLYVTLIFALVLLQSVAQDIDHPHGDLMASEMADFNKFVSEADHEFVGFLRNPWKEFATSEPIVSRDLPEPSKPIVFEKGLSQDISPMKLATMPMDAPDVPNEESSCSNVDLTNVESTLPKTSVGSIVIDYFGTTLHIDGSLKGVCRLRGLAPDDIADAYECMCRVNAKPLLDNISSICAALHLNDWGVYVLIAKAADALCDDHNTAVVLKQMLLNRIGILARMARRADRNEMLLFVATSSTLYACPYTTHKGINYYNVDSKEACQFYMYTGDYSQHANPMSMLQQEVPRLEPHYNSYTRCTPDDSVSVVVDINLALMDYYASMPQCDYRVYATAATDTITSHALLASLSPIVIGVDKDTAANRLLHFVQTAFSYATDDEQFGYEKPFFVEECFYYASCDCEDRAVLFAYLVRQLLGLDVVLLGYPNHVATAVAFDNDVSGDYIDVQSRRYVVCDPTYIGASIGMCMPQYKDVEVRVIR